MPTVTLYDPYSGARVDFDSTEAPARIALGWSAVASPNLAGGSLPVDRDTLAEVSALIAAGGGGGSNAITASYVTSPGPTRDALSGTYQQVWKANTAYAQGASAVSPTGQIIKARVAHTSGATYDSANWIVQLESATVTDGGDGLLDITLGATSAGGGAPVDLTPYLKSADAAAAYRPKTSIFARDYLPATNPTPALNRAGLQAAVDAAIAAGKDVCLDGIPFPTQIDNYVYINSPGLRVWSSNEDLAKVSQVTKPLGCFVVNATDVTFDRVWFDGNNPDFTFVYDFDHEGCNGVKFAKGAHRGRVLNCRGSDLFRAVYFQSNPRDALPADIVLLEDCVVSGLRVANVWGGVQAFGMSNFIMERLTGWYRRTTASGAPAHMVYLTVIYDNAGVPLYYNRNVTLRDCVATGSVADISDAAAFSLRATKGLTYDNIRAVDCPGVIDAIWLEDVVGGSYSSTADRYTVASSRGSIAFTNCNRVYVGPGIIDCAEVQHGPAVWVNVSTRVTVERPRVNFRVSSPAVTANSHSAIAIAGVDCRLINPDVENMGSTRVQNGILLTNGNDNLGTNPRLVGPRVRGDFARSLRVAPLPAASVEYDPANIDGGLIKLLLDNTAFTPTIRNLASPFVRDACTVGWHDGEPLYSDSNPEIQRRWTSGQMPATISGQWKPDAAQPGYFYETTGNSIGLMTADFGIADVDISVGARLSGSGSNRMGIAFRLGAGDDYLAFIIDSTMAAIVKRTSADTGNPEPTLASATPVIARSRLHQLRVVAIGALVQGYLDGALVVSHTLSSADQSTYNARTVHGLVSRGGSASRFYFPVVRRVG